MIKALIADDVGLDYEFLQNLLLSAHADRLEVAGTVGDGQGSAGKASPGTAQM